MAFTCPALLTSSGVARRGAVTRGLLPTPTCSAGTRTHVTAHLVRWPGPSQTANRLCAPRQAVDGENPSGSSSGSPGDMEDEIDRLLGLGRYHATGQTSIFGSLNIPEPSININGSASSEKPAVESSEVADTLADVMQMEVRRVRAKAELAEDMEERKRQMRAIGEEMKAALAREYELDRQRAEMGANYHMSEALQQLDGVEADIERIKQQIKVDKADLAAWEAKAAEARSRGLFFKSLYTVEKEKRSPVGKSIPGYWRKRRAEEAAAAASGEGAESSSSTWDAESVAAAAERPLSAASRQVRSPFRLYFFSYLSAFLALVVVNDLAAISSDPSLAGDMATHAAKDVLYGVLSAGLGLVAAKERSAMGQAQDAMLEGIRRTAGGKKRGGSQE